jgi:hypothetical protein
MTFFADIRTAIESRLKTNWATTAIAWDNVEYNPVASTAFIRLIVDEVDSRQISMATVPCHRAIGLIHIMIMVPTNTGTATARGYADSLSDIFRNADFSSIKCMSPRIRRVGDVGEHYQYSLLIPFTYDKSLANAA